MVLRPIEAGRQRSSTLKFSATPPPCLPVLNRKAKSGASIDAARSKGRPTRLAIPQLRCRRVLHKTKLDCHLLPILPIRCELKLPTPFLSFWPAENSACQHSTTRYTLCVPCAYGSIFLSSIGLSRGSRFSICSSLIRTSEAVRGPFTTQKGRRAPRWH